MCFSRPDSCRSINQTETKLSPGWEDREWSCWTSLKRVNSETSFWPSSLLGLFYPASAPLGIKVSGEVEVNVEGQVLFFNPLGAKNLSKYTTVFLKGVKMGSFYCLKGDVLPHPPLVAFREGSIPARAWKPLKRTAVPNAHMPPHRSAPVWQISTRALLLVAREAGLKEAQGLLAWALHLGELPPLCSWASPTETPCRKLCKSRWGLHWRGAEQQTGCCKSKPCGKPSQFAELGSMSELAAFERD